MSTEITDDEITELLALIEGVPQEGFNPLNDDALCFQLLSKYAVTFYPKLEDGELYRFGKPGPYAACHNHPPAYDQNPNKAVCLAIVRTHGYVQKTFLVSQQKLMEEIAINCVSDAAYKFALTGPDPKLTTEEFNVGVMAYMRDSNYVKEAVDQFLHEDQMNCVLERETFVRLEWLFWEKVRSSFK